MALSQDFNLIVACQRIFNVVPTFVEDSRLADGTGEVRFLATLRDDSGMDISDLYDDEGILALGQDDEDVVEGLAAVEDDFDGKPCCVVVRRGESYLEDGTFTLEVTVLLGSLEETRHQAITRVRCASISENFENSWERRMRAAARKEEADRAEAQRRESNNSQGRSLFDRLFGKKQ